ncbi:MAG: hypothetical protein CENE_00521 [Candidatus Celerinatantimonas neptuna]|nr:MAG: hypothetical protein CENE_00521 [Candidatus Celerinatantimonas neptuna]
MKLKYKLNSHYNILFESPDDGYSYFFGYYDKSPLNKNCSKLLAHRVSFDGRDVQDGDIAEVGYFDLLTGEFTKIDETLAWNWQQGSQLQWLPPKYDEEVIYNSCSDGRFISIIYNIKSKTKKIIHCPIYVIHPNGKEALGVNYERHYWCRPGYNYKNIKNKKWDKPYHKEDGIYKINLETGDFYLIIKTEDIINNARLPEFDVSNSWLEHIMYNPSGDRFMFFHRWSEAGVDHSRVYTVDNQVGDNIFMYPDVRFYSHHYWKDDKKLSIWTCLPKSSQSSITKTSDKIKRIRLLKLIIKPLYKSMKVLLPNNLKSKISNQSKLFLYNDKTTEFEIIGNNILFGNGHQSWFRDKKRLLIDTYQDGKNYRNLMIFDSKQNLFKHIGKFFSVYNDCGYRCDLHPRLSSNEKMVVIDSAHTNKRKLIIINIDKN